jgi:hypothetical protein
VKPFTIVPTASGGTAQATSTGTADVKTITPPKGASSALITVETTSARMTFDGSTPSSGNGIVVPTAALPLLIPVGVGCTIKFAATAAANSVVDVAWFR